MKMNFFQPKKEPESRLALQRKSLQASHALEKEVEAFARTVENIIKKSNTRANERKHHSV